MSEPDIADVLQHFELSGHFDSAERFGSGHINDTWLIRFAHSDRRKRYVLQRINAYVFADPVAVCENIERICTHLAGVAENGSQQALPRQRDFVPLKSRTGEPCWKDPGGDVWRLWPFIYGASTVDRVSSPAQAREAAAAFGWFQRMAEDLPGPPLHETIPGFHDTAARFDQFRTALDDDPQGRSGKCRAEIEFALQSEPCIREFSALVRSGTLPIRIAHNDTKINNVMFDDETSSAVCVIDLDTVMPGLAHYDFGDMVRTMTVGAAEDETDLDQVHLDIDLFEMLLDGYLGAMGSLLSAAEVRYLPDAGKILTLETGLRFLADHLSGDRYFRTARPGQNLDRCRTQFALVRSIDAQWDAMQSLTERIATMHRG